MKKLKPADTQIVLQLMELADGPQNLEAMQYIVFQFDFQEYEQFVIEAPPGSIRFNNLIRVAFFYDNVGALVAGDAVDPNVIFEIFPVPWAKVEPIIQGMRRELGWPDMFDHFESLGQRYQKWWEDRRKRMKGEASEIAPPSVRPKVVPLTRPLSPPKPATPRPGIPGQSPVMRGAGARPTTAVRPATPRPAAMPPRSIVLPSSPVARPVARDGQGQRSAVRISKPAARPLPTRSARPKSAAKRPAAGKATKEKAKSRR